eukprot:scaffold207300_cov15-Tisochrysis_lutea.AAC.1
MAKLVGQFVDMQASCAGAWKGSYAWASTAQFSTQLCCYSTFHWAEYADGWRVETGADSLFVWVGALGRGFGRGPSK